PGNLRELRHEMQRASVMATQNELTPGDLSFHAPTAHTRGGEDVPGKTLQDKVENLERREISRHLERFDGNRTQTAEALGLSRQGLLNKIGRYELE
ncbi:MAG: helix-turn-helix domain-containing protein, partial [Bradymonadaceae bacterium]